MEFYQVDDVTLCELWHVILAEETLSMRSILVVNPKGGGGKTMIATNLAGIFAAQGKRVVLADMDRQQSAANWLARRPETAPHIMAWTAATDKKEIKA